MSEWHDLTIRLKTSEAIPLEEWDDTLALAEAIGKALRLPEGTLIDYITLTAVASSKRDHQHKRTWTWVLHHPITAFKFFLFWRSEWRRTSEAKKRHAS